MCGPSLFPPISRTRHRLSEAREGTSVTRSSSPSADPRSLCFDTRRSVELGCMAWDGPSIEGHPPSNGFVRRNSPLLAVSDVLYVSTVFGAERKGTAGCHISSAGVRRTGDKSQSFACVERCYAPSTEHEGSGKQDTWKEEMHCKNWRLPLHS